MEILINFRGRSLILEIEGFINCEELEVCMKEWEKIAAQAYDLGFGNGYDAGYEEGYEIGWDQG